MMTALEAVKEVMRIKNVKQIELAERIKVKQNTLSERLTQKNVSVQKLDEMLNAMDYKIVVVPRNAKVPENGFEVE